MKSGEIAAGSLVRYPRTGTAGTVESVEKIEGKTFAKIDSSGLLYRVDQLITIDHLVIKEHRESDALEGFKMRKRVSSEDIEEAFENVDGVGAG